LSTPSGLHARSTMDSFRTESERTSTSHFFEPCIFQRLTWSLPFCEEIVTTRSLSGQHAEGSNREETGSWSLANETNGLLTFIMVCVEIRRPGTSACTLIHKKLSPFPPLDLISYNVASLCADTLLLAPFPPLIMTKPCFT
jgi:hypothetical protein